MKTIAVTGAAGFIGANLVDRALAAGYAVRALARDISRIEPRRNLTRFEYDIAVPDSLSKSLAGADAVCHLAGYIPKRQNDPDLAETCFRINALGTLTLVRFAAEAGVSRFVHTCSANAYASGEEHPAENAQMLPIVRAPFYLASKMTQEIFVAHAGRQAELPVACLRLSSVYGPGQTQGLVAHLLETLLSGQTLRLVNGGRFGADFVSVRDVSMALLAAIESRFDGPVNIGSGVRASVIEVARNLCEGLNVDPRRIDVGNAPDEDDVGFPALDISRARAVLGFTPMQLHAGLAEMISSRTASYQRDGRSPGSD